MDIYVVDCIRRRYLFGLEIFKGRFQIFLINFDTKCQLLNFRNRKLLGNLMDFGYFNFVSYLT